MKYYEILLMKQPKFRFLMVKPLKFTAPAAAAPGNEHIGETLASGMKPAADPRGRPGGPEAVLTRAKKWA